MNKDNYYTVEEAANILGKKYRNMLKHAKVGNLAYFQGGPRQEVFIPKECVKCWKRGDNDGPEMCARCVTV